MSESYGQTTDAYDPNGILAGIENYNTREVVIASGDLPAGAVLGKITATGEYILSVAAAVDGSETPDLVLLEDRDATSAALKGVSLSAGQVDERRLTYGAGHTADSVREGLRVKGIFLKASVPA